MDQFFIETLVWDENNVSLGAQRRSFNTNCGKLVDLFSKNFISIACQNFLLIATGWNF